MIRKGRWTNPRGNDAYREFRRIVLKRDKYCCQMPGCKRRSRLQVHHIIRYSDSGYGRLNPDNGVTLCIQHHEEIKDKEGHYAKLFLDIVNKNNQKK